MGKAGNTGVTSKTPQNTFLGAGTIHKGLKYVAETGWNFAESLIGATSGGNKLSIIPEILSIEADGALVRTKELDAKQGEKASLELNMLELTEELVKKSLFAKDGVSVDESYNLIESKADIDEGDYLENIAFVGKNLKGQNIIVILDNALCTSGLEVEGKNKEGTVTKYTFECSADLESDLQTLPWHIYYPKAVNG